MTFYFTVWQAIFSVILRTILKTAVEGAKAAGGPDLFGFEPKRQFTAE